MLLFQTEIQLENPKDSVEAVCSEMQCGVDSLLVRSAS